MASKVFVRIEAKRCLNCIFTERVAVRRGGRLKENEETAVEKEVKHVHFGRCEVVSKLRGIGIPPSLVENVRAYDYYNDSGFLWTVKGRITEQR